MGWQGMGAMGWASSLPGTTAAAGRSVGAVSPGDQKTPGMPAPHCPHPELPMAGTGRGCSHTSTPQGEVSSWSGHRHVAPCHPQKFHQGLLLGGHHSWSQQGCAASAGQRCLSFPSGRCSGTGVWGIQAHTEEQQPHTTAVPPRLLPPGHEAAPAPWRGVALGWLEPIPDPSPHASRKA